LEDVFAELLKKYKALYVKQGSIRDVVILEKVGERSDDGLGGEGQRIGAFFRAVNDLKKPPFTEQFIFSRASLEASWDVCSTEGFPIRP